MVKPILLAQVMPSDLAFSSFSFSPLSGSLGVAAAASAWTHPTSSFDPTDRQPTNHLLLLFPTSQPYFSPPPSFLCPKRQSLLRRKWGGEMGGRAGMSRGNLGEKPPTHLDANRFGGGSGGEKSHFCRPGKLFPAAFEIEKYATLHQKKSKAQKKWLSARKGGGLSPPSAFPLLPTGKSFELTALTL